MDLMAVLHADIERHMAAAGIESTIIRPGMFASNTMFWWRPRFGPTVSSGGPTVLPRRHQWTTATWQRSRRGPCTRTDMPAATTSSPAPSR
jgi:hypothetical protein